MAKPFSRHWTWQLSCTPEQLWPFVSDTNRFNRDIGLPSLEVVRTGAKRRLSARSFGLSMEWEEMPFEWIKPNTIGTVRRYEKGPFSEIHLVVNLERHQGGTRLTAVFSAQARYAAVRLTMPMYTRLFFSKKINETILRYDRLAASKGEDSLPTAKIEFVPGGKERLASYRAALLKKDLNAAAVDALVKIIESGDELTISRLRPHALADLWNMPRRAILELCLHATRAGMLEFQWEFLCPLCRGPQQKVTALADATSQLHCDSCNIDFEVNLDRSVELTFRPNQAIRQYTVKTFCVGGPNLTPHIVVQQRLKPGESKTISPMLEGGRYQLRLFRQAGSQFLAVKNEGAPSFSITAGEAWNDQEVSISPAPMINFANKTNEEQVYVLERLAWTDQAATAAEVTALQAFRDLFSAEALRSGEQISVGTMTIVFTDLKGSTKMYQEIGDAPAFGLVLTHFDVIKAAIAEYDGAIVKNIGDAIMAVFRRPANAIQAMLKAQAALGMPEAKQRPLTLRSGMHAGPCIAVNLNNRLDYFGTTVNKAARLEGKSLGNDVVVSEDVYNDPEVKRLVANGGGYKAEMFEDELKGFEGKARLYRISIAK